MKIAYVRFEFIPERLFMGANNVSFRHIIYGSNTDNGVGMSIAQIERAMDVRMERGLKTCYKSLAPVKWRTKNYDGHSSPWQKCEDHVGGAAYVAPFTQFVMTSEGLPLQSTSTVRATWWVHFKGQRIVN